MKIYAGEKKWDNEIDGPKTSVTWPEEARHVKIVWPDGATSDCEGERDDEGNSTDYNPTGSMAIGSPVYQVLVEHGFTPT